MMKKRQRNEMVNSIMLVVDCHRTRNEYSEKLGYLENLLCNRISEEIRDLMKQK